MSLDIIKNRTSSNIFHKDLWSLGIQGSGLYNRLFNFDDYYQIEELEKKEKWLSNIEKENHFDRKDVDPELIDQVWKQTQEKKMKGPYMIANEIGVFQREAPNLYSVFEDAREQPLHEIYGRKEVEVSSAPIGQPEKGLLSSISELVTKRGPPLPGIQQKNDPPIVPQQQNDEDTTVTTSIQNLAESARQRQEEIEASIGSHQQEHIVMRTTNIPDFSNVYQQLMYGTTVPTTLPTTTHVITSRETLLAPRQDTIKEVEKTGTPPTKPITDTSDNWDDTSEELIEDMSDSEEATDSGTDEEEENNMLEATRQKLQQEREEERKKLQASHGARAEQQIQQQDERTKQDLGVQKTGPAGPVDDESSGSESDLEDDDASYYQKLNEFKEQVKTKFNAKTKDWKKYTKPFYAFATGIIWLYKNINDSIRGKVILNTAMGPEWKNKVDKVVQAADDVVKIVIEPGGDVTEVIQRIGANSDIILEYASGARYLRNVKEGAFENMVYNLDTDIMEIKDIAESIKNQNPQTGGKLYVFWNKNGIVRVAKEVANTPEGRMTLMYLGKKFIPPTLHAAWRGTKATAQYGWKKMSGKGSDKNETKPTNDTGSQPPDDDDDDDQGGGGGGPAGRLMDINDINMSVFDENATVPVVAPVPVVDSEDEEEEVHADLDDLDNIDMDMFDEAPSDQEEILAPPPQPTEQAVTLDKHFDLRDADNTRHPDIPKEANMYAGSIPLNPQHEPLSPKTKTKEPFWGDHPLFQGDNTTGWQLPIQEDKGIYKRSRTSDNEDDEKEITIDGDEFEEETRQPPRDMKKIKEQLQTKNKKKSRDEFDAEYIEIDKAAVRDLMGRKDEDLGEDELKVKELSKDVKNLIKEKQKLEEKLKRYKGDRKQTKLIMIELVTIDDAIEDKVDAINTLMDEKPEETKQQKSERRVKETKEALKKIREDQTKNISIPEENEINPLESQKEINKKRAKHEREMKRQYEARQREREERISLIGDHPLGNKALRDFMDDPDDFLSSTEKKLKYKMIDLQDMENEKNRRIEELNDTRKKHPDRDTSQKEEYITMLGNAMNDAMIEIYDLAQEWQEAENDTDLSSLEGKLDRPPLATNYTDVNQTLELPDPDDPDTDEEAQQILDDIKHGVPEQTFETDTVSDVINEIQTSESMLSKQPLNQSYNQTINRLDDLDISGFDNILQMDTHGTTIHIDKKVNPTVTAGMLLNDAMQFVSNIDSVTGILNFGSSDQPETAKTTTTGVSNTNANRPLTQEQELEQRYDKLNKDWQVAGNTRRVTIQKQMDNINHKLQEINPEKYGPDEEVLRHTRLENEAPVAGGSRSSHLTGRDASSEMLSRRQELVKRNLAIRDAIDAEYDKENYSDQEPDYNKVDRLEDEKDRITTEIEIIDEQVPSIQELTKQKFNLKDPVDEEPVAEKEKTKDHFGDPFNELPPRSSLQQYQNSKQLAKTNNKKKVATLPGQTIRLDPTTNSTNTYIPEVGAKHTTLGRQAQAINESVTQRANYKQQTNTKKLVEAIINLTPEERENVLKYATLKKNALDNDDPDIYAEIEKYENDLPSALRLVATDIRDTIGYVGSHVTNEVGGVIPDQVKQYAYDIWDGISNLVSTKTQEEYPEPEFMSKNYDRDMTRHKLSKKLQVKENSLREKISKLTPEQIEQVKHYFNFIETTRQQSRDRKTHPKMKSWLTDMKIAWGEKMDEYGLLDDMMVEIREYKNRVPKSSKIMRVDDNITKNKQIRNFQRNMINFIDTYQQTQNKATLTSYFFGNEKQTDTTKKSEPVVNIPVPDLDEPETEPIDVPPVPISRGQLPQGFLEHLPKHQQRKTIKAFQNERERNIEEFIKQRNLTRQIRNLDNDKRQAALEYLFVRQDIEFEENKTRIERLRTTLNNLANEIGKSVMSGLFIKTFLYNIGGKKVKETIDFAKPSSNPDIAASQKEMARVFNNMLPSMNRNAEPKMIQQVGKTGNMWRLNFGGQTHINTNYNTNTNTNYNWGKGQKVGGRVLNVDRK